MRKLTVFNNITLDGYFTGPGGDLSWAHVEPSDREWSSFVEGNATGGGMLLLGRITYDMMAGYWPTPMAMTNDPVVATRMNELEKVVFSRTMRSADWQNTTLVKDLSPAYVRALKESPGPDMTILGSGSIVAQMTEAGLVDEYQFIVNPVVLGNGRTMFANVSRALNLKLAGSRTFGNGKIVLRYQPVESA